MKAQSFHLSAAMILPAALLLSQCAPTSGTQPQPPTVSSATSEHWVKVSSRPPTFYPRGVAADSPTDCQSGEWVHTGDAQDTRYFIPLHGLTKELRMGLRGEALAARSQGKVRQIAREDRQIAREDALQASKACLKGLLLLPPLALKAVFESSDRASGGGISMGGIRPSVGAINCPSIPGCPSGGGGCPSGGGGCPSGGGGPH